MGFVEWGATVWTSCKIILKSFYYSLSCTSEEESNVVNVTGFLKFVLLINADALNYNRFCDFSLNELTLYKESSSVL